MGKLKDMVAEQVSLPERLKISARRMRLAGIGLASKVDAERARLYRQAMELGESYGRDDGLVGKLTRLGTGTVHLVIEESQRLFDELVEAGEQTLAGHTPRGARTSALHTPRPVARPSAPRPVAVSTRSRPASRPALKPVAKQETASEPPAELRQAFEQAQTRLKELSSPPDQATLLALYALFKQATEGDVSGRRPGATKLVERAKFDERQKVKGLSRVEAMSRYVETVAGLSR